MRIEALYQRGASAAVAALLLFSPIRDVSPLLPSPIMPAAAKELASGSGSKVNKDPLSLLRLGLPNQPKALRDVQTKLEETDDQLSRILINNAKSAYDTAKGTLKGKSKEILAAVPAADKSRGEALLASINDNVAELGDSLAAGKASSAQASAKSALESVTKLEEIIASAYVQPKPPAEFSASLPYLKGRATVNMIARARARARTRVLLPSAGRSRLSSAWRALTPHSVHLSLSLSSLQIDWELKREGGKFDVDGKLYDTLQLTTVVDGYTAPITSGNFVDLVQKGFYNGYKVQRSDGFVVQTGDAKVEGKSEKNGYVPPGKTEVRTVPLELYVKGDPQPLYSTTFDDVRAAPLARSIQRAALRSAQLTRVLLLALLSAGRPRRLCVGAAIQRLRRPRDGARGVQCRLGVVAVLLAALRLRPDACGQELARRAVRMLRLHRGWRAPSLRREGGRRHRLSQGHLGAQQPGRAFRQLRVVGHGRLFESRGVSVLRHARAGRRSGILFRCGSNRRRIARDRRPVARWLLATTGRSREAWRRDRTMRACSRAERFSILLT